MILGATCPGLWTYMYAVFKVLPLPILPLERSSIRFSAFPQWSQEPGIPEEQFFSAEV